VIGNVLRTMRDFEEKEKEEKVKANAHTLKN